jgi:hypothetical protein
MSKEIICMQMLKSLLKILLNQQNQMLSLILLLKTVSMASSRNHWRLTYRNDTELLS